MIVDTSALLAFYIPREPMHRPVSDALLGSNEPLIVSPFVLAELDYLLLTREGVRSEIAVLNEFVGNAWTTAGFGADDLHSAVSVIEKYADQNIGLADASMVVLADKYRTRTIATLDRRHFGAVRPLSGGRFRIVP